MRTEPKAENQLDVTKALGQVGISQPLAELLAPEQIKSVLPQFYRTIAKLLHPDAQVGQSPEEQARAMRSFKLLERAYSAVSSRAENATAWANLMKSLGASDGSREARGELVDATVQKLARDYAALEQQQKAQLETIKTLIKEIRERERLAPGTSKKSGVKEANILAPGSLAVVMSGERSSEKDDQKEEADRDDDEGYRQAMPHVRIYTDVRKNVIQIETVNCGGDVYDHLKGASIIGVIDAKTYGALGRGPHASYRASDAPQLASSGPAMRQSSEPWAISRDQFSRLIVPKIRLTITEGSSLVFTKSNESGESLYYVSYPVGLDGNVYKRAIEHNPLP